MASLRAQYAATGADSSSTSLIIKTEQEIRDWSGFSKNTRLRNQGDLPLTPHPNSRRTQREHRKRDTTTAPTQLGAPPIPDRAPGHSLPPVDYRTRLKRKSSPRVLSLREIRVKESEAALRSVFESGVTAYLTDSIKPYHSVRGSDRTKWSFSESSSEEDIKEEPEEEDVEDEYVLAPVDGWSASLSHRSGGGRGWLQ